MPGETHNGMPCNEFEALLFEVLDQKVTGSLLESFHAHARSCSKCGPMFTEIEAGQHWLKSLTEVEPPASLVSNILAATSGLDTFRLQEPVIARYQPSLTERIREWTESFFTPVWGTVRQPRFAMSFGMAFFSLSVALSVFGFKPRDLKQLDLSRNGLTRTYYGTQARVVKYYENMRLVYEIESRVREFKRVTAPEPAKPEKDEHKNNSSGAPEPRQDRNYASDETQPVLASLTEDPSQFTLTSVTNAWKRPEPVSAPDAPPAVSVTTNRRFV